MLLIAGAFLINYAVTAEQLDRALAAWIVGAKFSATDFMLMINVILIILGCLIDTGAFDSHLGALVASNDRSHSELTWSISASSSQLTSSSGW